MTVLLFDSEDGDYMFLRNVYGVYQTARRYNVEDHALHSHQSENLISNERQPDLGPQKKRAGERMTESGGKYARSIIICNLFFTNHAYYLW
jgi:hypothetical protein